MVAAVRYHNKKYINKNVAATYKPTYDATASPGSNKNDIRSAVYHEEEIDRRKCQNKVEETTL